MKVPSNSKTMNVHIQGSKVLKFVSLKTDEVLFEVVGSTKPKVRIIDQRPEVRNKMKEIIKTKEVEQLTDLFCQPARVVILPSEKEKSELIVQLKATRAKKPRYMLWIATGLSGEIPCFDYQRLDVQPFNKKTFLLFSIYKRPTLMKK
jgi:hypothetical protein